MGTDEVIALLKQSEAESCLEASQLRFSGFEDEAQNLEHKAETVRLTLEWIFELDRMNP